MRFLIILTLIAAPVLISPQYTYAAVNKTMLTDQTAGVIDEDKLSIMLKKLRSQMLSMKDLNQLEAIGMNKRDVDRMRNVLQAKIETMIQETITVIHSL